jgi:hypothetical protein
MTTVGPGPAAPAVAASFVEWGAVLAGAALSAAISFVLLTFGTAIGLSATSPWLLGSGAADRGLHGGRLCCRPHAVALGGNRR